MPEYPWHEVNVFTWLSSLYNPFIILRRNKVYGTEASSIDRILNKEHFYGKIIRKYVPKASHSFLILVNNPKQPLHWWNYF